MKLKKLFFLILIIFLSLSCSQKKEYKYETAVVKLGNISSTIPSTGTVTPRNRLEIKPPVGGRIENVLAEEGQVVSKGQILAWMSSSERAALLDAARFKGAGEFSYWQNVYKPTPIVAPLDGFIILRSVEPGQTVMGSDAILAMADRLIIKAQVDETDIGKITLKQKVDIVLDAYSAQTIKGWVEHISYESKVINNVTIYEVNIIPDDVPVFFRSGMSATVKFMEDEKKNVLLLPSNAVKKRNERAFVFIKKENKKDISTLDIETGLENDNYIEIVSGLNEGDEVIIPTAKMVQDMAQNSRGRRFVNPFGSQKK